ncbi:MAG: DNA primase [Syntrophomonadaceae bacterium]|nr:DNA primase [Syntrophomonadaceae bacterium]
MTRYDDPVIREIIDRLNIVDIVAETVNLTRKGNRYWGLCPFHDEKTASFTVTPERNMYYCFGCHAGGDAFSFVMKTRGLDFKEALELLAGKAGVELANQPRGRELDRRKRIIEVNQAAAEYYHQVLAKVPEAMTYISGRGLDQDIVEKFHLGFAMDQWNHLEDYLLRKGYSQEYIKASGLIKRNDRRNSYYDLFRARIMFPIYNQSGSVIGFGGRVLDDGMPKYLNTPDTEVYSKRQNLYGLYQGKEAIRQSNEVLLVEGYMDCIRMHQFGFINCVATLGTALTKEQASLMHRYAENVIIIYDGDEAGQREALRASSILVGEGLKTSVLTLPEGKDPDELLELSGKEEFRRYIKNNKTTHIEFRLNRYMIGENMADLEAKIRVISTVSPDIKALNSELEKDFYVKLLSRRLALEENLVRRELARNATGRADGSRNKTGNYRDNIQYGNYSIDEKILAAMLSNEEIFVQIRDAIGIRFFKQEEYSQLAELYNSLARGNDHPLEEMDRNVQGEALQAAYARIVTLVSEPGQMSKMEVESFIRQVQRHRVKARWHKMLKRMEKLDNHSDFKDLLGFILEIDRFLKHTQEGGTV